MAAAPNSAQALIGVVTLAAGVAAASLVKPDKAVDYTLHKLASAYVRLVYTADDLKAAEGGQPIKRGFIESGVRSFSKFIDQNAVALQWKMELNNFDQKSPIPVDMLVRLLVGATTFLVTKKVLRIAMV